MYLKSPRSPANSVDVGFNRSGEIKVYDIGDVLEVHASGHTKFFIFTSGKEKTKDESNCHFLNSFIISMELLVHFICNTCPGNNSTKYLTTRINTF